MEYAEAKSMERFLPQAELSFFHKQYYRHFYT